VFSLKVEQALLILLNFSLDMLHDILMCQETESERHTDIATEFDMRFKLD
jgi:hypothetical protein